MDGEETAIGCPGNKVRRMQEQWEMGDLEAERVNMGGPRWIRVRRGLWNEPGQED